MTIKRLWIALLAIPVCLIPVLIIGAQKSQPANAGGVIDPTCVSSLPCIEYDNNGTGPAIRGIALGGNGVAGSTHINSTSATNARAGVFGKDDSTSGSFNSGVSGLSARGNGVLGNSNSGIGVQATSSNFIGALVVGGLVDAVHFDNFPALSIIGSVAGGDFSDLIDACRPMTSSSLCFNTNSLFRVSSLGDVVTSGEVFASTNGFFGRSLAVGGAVIPAAGDVNIQGQYLKQNTCVSGCAISANSPGRAIASYGAQESVPTIEDFGEAQLVNGLAYVPLGADFANVIDRRPTYVVFITPEGPSRGLYVTHKTTSGFTVAENPDGHSTLAFAYRIVAKPYGSTASRLPMVELQRGSSHRRLHASTAGSVLSIH